MRTLASFFNADDSLQLDRDAIASRNVGEDVTTKMVRSGNVTNASAWMDACFGGASTRVIGGIELALRPSRDSAQATTAAALHMTSLLSFDSAQDTPSGVEECRRLASPILGRVRPAALTCGL
jgi:hypothetical protein